MAELRATLNYVPGTNTTLKFKALKIKSSFWCPETVHFGSVQFSAILLNLYENLRFNNSRKGPVPVAARSKA